MGETADNGPEAVVSLANAVVYAYRHGLSARWTENLVDRFAEAWRRSWE